ncbi:hypothetical protein ACHAPE_005029 [Trichoderma viride]
MPQTRSATRKQREKEMNRLKADSNDQAGGSSALDGSLPCSQEAGGLSALNIGGPDIATFGSLEEFLNQVPSQQQEQQQQQEEQQLVLYDPLSQPYLPWDCPGSDQQLYSFPVPAMADNQHCLSPSYFVEPNYFASDFTQQQYNQFGEYQALQPWVSPGLAEAALMDVQGIQSQAGEFLYTNGDGSYEPLLFEYAVTQDHLVQDPLLDARWAATYEGNLFGNSQVLDGTIPNETVALDENAEANSHVASPAQPLTAISPVTGTQEQQQRRGKKRPARAHPKIPFVLAASKAEVEKARRRRLAGRRRKGPKPVVEVDWLPHGADRETKDRFLVEARAFEVSYKMIKLHGRFKEAESTLRGRYRTLTKAKEDRVRDPQWTAIDIQLLKEAVQVYAGSEHPDEAGISWMMVSQYIKNHGGSYSFGYNTSHRRWLHLERTGQLGDNVFDESWESYDDDENEVVDDEMEGVEPELSDEPKVEDDDESEGEGDNEAEDASYEEEN